MSAALADRRLAELGIRLRRDGPGKHRATCPECARAKVRRGDDALAVLIAPDGQATWLCHRCGWKGTTRAPVGPQERDRASRPLQKTPPGPRTRCSGLPAAAAALWHTTSAISADTVAGHYLAARGCALPHPDGDLRFLANHRHLCGWWGPCLVALVTDAVTAEPMTLHRTWIREDGAKADVDRPRLLWPGAPKAGGCIRLWPGDETTLGLLIGEGLETALTGAHGFQPVWACIDAANLSSFPVLPGIEHLTITADHDSNGVGQRAAEACARRWAEAGVEVAIWINPTPGDLNDYQRTVA